MDCLRIAIKKDGTFGKPEVYSKDFPALPDGMAFAADGNLFVTLPAFIRDGKMAPAHQILKVDTNGNWTDQRQLNWVRVASAGNVTLVLLTIRSGPLRCSHLAHPPAFNHLFS
jgi:hypothetical protein